MELHRLVLWTIAEDLVLILTPIRRLKNIATGRDIVLTRPEDSAKW
jgi:hypothetical protein